MNVKISLAILFVIPTIILAFIYYYFGINNYLQLFLFLCMAIICYAPGALMLRIVQLRWSRDKIRDDLDDAEDANLDAERKA